MAQSAEQIVAPTSGLRLGQTRYILWMLLLVHVFNQLDRNILGILAEPVKNELHLSDTQLGLVNGLAFGLFYAFLGLPAAWIADRRNRRNFVALACAVWSILTAACGLATSFWQLFAGRIGVAIGEAGSGPASVSMISDLYPRERRSGAMAVYSIGKNLGVMVGFVLGGIITHLWNWHWAFVAIGLPGVLLAVVVQLTVKEPGRSDAVARAADAPSTAGVLEAWSFMLRSRACRNLLLGSSFAAFVSYSVAAFTPSFMIRTFHLTTKDAGLILGPIMGLVGAAAAIGGGRLADRLEARDPRGNAWMVSVSRVLAGVIGVACYLSAGPVAAGVMFALFTGFQTVYLGSTYAMIQTLTPHSMRAMTAAIMLLCVNLVGLGLGPPITGAISDALHPHFGQDSLRYALVIICLLGLPAVWFYWSAGVGYRDEVLAANARNDA